MEQLGVALRVFGLLTLLTGFVYPLLVTVAAQVAVPQEANGSLVRRNGEVIGSKLIAQKMVDPKYFWPRPSAVDYKPNPSGGSNLGPTSAKLKEQVKLGSGLPLDLVFASASGLDPEISPEAARFQIERVAHARGYDDAKRRNLEKLVNDFTRNDQLGFLGEKRVNVLELNLSMNEEAMTEGKDESPAK